MKKILFATALLCGVSFSGNATTQVNGAAIEKQPMSPTKVCKLYEITFSCPSGAWSCICYGHTQAEAQEVFDFYRTSGAC